MSKYVDLDSTWNELPGFLRKVYVSGPMRGYPKFNFPAFDRAAELGRSLGFEVISPADMDRENGIDENMLMDQCKEFTQEDHRTFARRDSDVILSLEGESEDAIALLPKWEWSTGAVAELFLSRWVGLKVLNAETFRPFTFWEIIRINPIPLVWNVFKYIWKAR